MLDEAIANKPQPWQIKKRFDIKEEKSVKATGSVYRHVDDGVAIFASWESANIRVTMWNFRSHVRGKYRFRISGYGFQSEGKPVNFHVTAGTLKEVTEERLIDYFAVPADKPTVIEFTEQLEPENRIRIIADGLPALPPAVEKVGADKYTGPGLVIQWVDVEGPLLESWPPPSHQGDLWRSEAGGRSKSRRSQTPRGRVAAADGRCRAHPARLRAAGVSARGDGRRHQAVPRAREDEAGPEVLVRAGDARRPQGRCWSRRISCSCARSAAADTLDDFALASRLSYFLWSSMPDEELLKLAAANKLREPDVLRAAGRAHAERSQGQGLHRELHRPMAEPPRHRRHAARPHALSRSTTTSSRRRCSRRRSLFFDEVLKNDLSLTNFVASDFTFLNARLAKHYGIPGVEGTEMRKVTLPPESHRGGVLTMGSVLKVTANGTTTSPDPARRLGAGAHSRHAAAEAAGGRGSHRARHPRRHDDPRTTRQASQGRELRQLPHARSIRRDSRSKASTSSAAGATTTAAIGEADEKSTAAECDSGTAPPWTPAMCCPTAGGFSNIDEYKKLLLDDKDQLARNLTEKLLAYCHRRSPDDGGQAADRGHRQPHPRQELRLQIVDSRDRAEPDVSEQVVMSKDAPMNIQRRTFLRSAGISLALPWLDAFAAIRMPGARRERPAAASHGLHLRAAGIASRQFLSRRRPARTTRSRPTWTSSRNSATTSRSSPAWRTRA